MNHICVAVVHKVAPNEWDARLDKGCGDNDELRVRVRKLLDAHDTTGSFMEQAAVAGTTTADMPAITEALARSSAA